jgi:phosphotransferase system  glucose/maltose/N-acetylglucosamine-specific IIC component
MIYQKFLTLLVVITIASISFVILFSIYLSEPNSLKVFGILTLIPWYLCCIMLTGLYIFISPGLLDPVNNIPFYQVVMAAIYLLFAFIYPVYLTIVIYRENLKQKNSGDPEVNNPNQHTIIASDEALCVNVPIIAALTIHVCAILP